MQQFPTHSSEVTEVNTLYAQGVKFDLTVYNGVTGSTINSTVGLMTKGAIEAIEGLNEWNLNGGAGWQTSGAAMQQTITTAIQTQPNLAGLYDYGLSLSNADYSQLGNLDGYMNASSMHDYPGGHYPENTGFGSVGYCGLSYGSIDYNRCDTQQVAPSRVVVATEDGVCTLSASVGCVPEDIQARYANRMYLEHFRLGVPRTYLYELFGENETTQDGTYGFVRSDLTQRPALPAVQGLLTIAADATPYTGTCNVPMTVGAPSPATLPVRTLALCKSDGSYAVALWLPGSSYDTSAQSYTPVASETATVTLASGFTPTSSRLWTMNASTGVWSSVSSPSLVGMTITDVPLWLTFNASPVTIPPLPSP